MITPARRITLAVERLADDRAFLARFRTDPHRTLRRYRLTDAQISAVQSGNAVALARQGVDVPAFLDGRRHGARAMIQRALVALGLMAATVGLSAGPARAERSAPRFSGVRRADRWAPRLSERLERSSIGEALARAVRNSPRVDPRVTPRLGVRRGFARSGLRTDLEAIGVDIDEDLKKDPGPIITTDTDGPFELGTADEG